MAMNRNRAAVVLTAAALAGGGAGAGVVAVTHGGSPHAAPAVEASAANIANTTLSVGQIAKTATRSVVEIDATTSGQSTPFPFGRGGGGGGSSSAAEGTGFVYDAKGDIVTNEHVVDGASTVSVKLSDGSTYKATVVGTDTSSDIAVVHVNAPASKLAPLALGDSSKVAVGDGVVAIGNPFGLDGTVTSGIVSAVDREIASPDSTPIEGAIQTDAAINHGNSGGPLLDLHGAVIGITSQIQSESGGSDGVGFAIPSDLVQHIADQLIATGKAEHALLGVTVKTVANGAAVATVERDTAAASAGLKAGDVITAVDGTKVPNAERLRAIIAAHEPGDKLTLKVLRSGSTQTITATLGTRT
jgi:putative serine protease PepD